MMMMMMMMMMIMIITELVGCTFQRGHQHEAKLTDG
jgi:outer membrane lipoprotein-sorting protein